MATEVDICNMALSLLGDEATVTSINPPEGSAQADHCRRFYPIALQELMAKAPWAFAIKRAELPKILAEPVGEPGKFSYQMPADCVKIVSVNGSSLPTSPQLRFVVEAQAGHSVLVTRAKCCWLRYVASSVPSGLFPAAFTQALVHKLASLLAGAMVPGSSGAQMAQQQIQLCEHYLAEAIHLNAMHQFDKRDYRSPFLGDGYEEPSHAFY